MSGIFIIISHTPYKTCKQYNKELSGKQKSSISQRQPRLITLYKTFQTALLCIHKYALKNYNNAVVRHDFLPLKHVMDGKMDK